MASAINQPEAQKQNEREKLISRLKAHNSARPLLRSAQRHLALIIERLSVPARRAESGKSGACNRTNVSDLLAFSRLHLRIKLDHVLMAKYYDRVIIANRQVDSGDLWRVCREGAENKLAMQLNFAYAIVLFVQIR